MKNIIILSLIMFAFSMQLNAQYGPYGSTDARSMGMANTYTATAGNIFAIGKNPAMLCYPTDMDSSVIILIPNIATQFYTNSISVDEINNYFGTSVKRYLSPEDKDKLYNYFGKEGEFYFDANANTYTISWTPSRRIGSFAISSNDFVSGYLFLPQDLIDLSLQGNETNREYNFDDFELQASWMRVFSVSYARDIYNSSGVVRNVSSGVTLKLINGFAHIESQDISSMFFTNDKHGLTGDIDATSRTAFAHDFGVSYEYDSTGKNQNLSYFSNPAGYGFGFDLGFAVQTDYAMTFGFSVTDIGSVKWTDNAAEHTIKGTAFVEDITDQDVLDSLVDLFENKSTALDNFETTLPTTLRIGVAYEISKTFESIPGYMMLAAGFNQGLIDQPLTTLKPRVSFGALWKPATYLPGFSTGITHDQTGAMRWSGGISYSSSLFYMGLSTYDMTSLFSSAKDAPHLSFAINMVWKFSYKTNQPELQE